MTSFAAIICLFAFHGGPADHFATFAENLTENGYEVQIFASGPALQKFQSRGIDVIQVDIENLSPKAAANLASSLAKRCCKASAVMTDVGHSFDISLQEALAKEAPEALRLAYYDNPEPYVPGGYSSVAAKVMLAASKALFANANLAKAALYEEPNKAINLDASRRIGLGYYPTAQAEKTRKQRKEECDTLRTRFFQQHALEDKEQKIFVYMGGNNDEYFTKAFPAFLHFLAEGANQSDLSNFIILFQQHPGAKSKNRDGQELDNWINEQGKNAKAATIVKSDWSSDEVQIVADGILYYQTSMGPQFALAGIPIIQVGHNTYEDILVRNHLCPSATTSSEFVKALLEVKPEAISEERQQLLFKGLGITSDWFKIFKQAITPLKQSD